MSRRDVVKLSDDEIQRALSTLDSWELVDGKLHRRFELENFVEAFAFMTKLALVAERMDHHPEWSNAYRVVDISLTTHDENGITNLDVEWARAADASLAGSR